MRDDDAEEDDARDADATANDDEDEDESTAMTIAKRQREELVRAFESRRRLRATHAPTNDADVRRALRKMREPVTLFGERAEDRRERLRAALAALDARDGGELEDGVGVGEDEDEGACGGMGKRQREIFYTEGTQMLLEARIEVAEWSLPRAARRNAAERATRARGVGGGGGAGGMSSVRDERTARVDAAVATTSRFQAQCSEIGDHSRPVCGVKFFDEGRGAVSASWSGEARRWTCDIQSGKLTSDLVIRATDHRITGVDAAASLLATSHADGTAAIWNASDGSRVREFKGHAARCGKICFHGMNKYVATAGFDATWRLWNVETGDELLCQEGHSKEVYDVAFHPDGSLAASVGLDAVGRVWDLRSGKSLSVLRGHVKQILSVDFSPNGYHVVTGSDDRTVKAWDLRKNGECLYTCASHQGLISCVRYEKTTSDGAFFASSGYDGFVNVYSGRDFALNKRIDNNAGFKIASVDLCGDGLLTGGFDRTVKLYVK